MSVAVIIPNRNNEAHIERCLSSLADDPGVSEVLVYDDGSTDGSVAIIDGFGCTKIRLMRGDQPIGASRARDVLIAQTRQPYLSFVDGDDFLAEGTISACLERALADDLDMCIPEQVKVGREETRREPFLPAPKGVFGGEDALIANIGSWRIGAPRGVVRRDTYLAAINGFEFYGYSDDELLTRRMLLACRRIGGAAGTYFYRFEARDPPLDQRVARLFTAIKSLALAQSVGRQDWEDTLRAHRDHAVMESLRLARTGARGKVPVRELLQGIDDLGIPWRPRDAPYRFLSRLLSALR